MKILFSNTTYLFISIFLISTPLSGQIRLQFSDKITRDLISDVQVITNDHHLFYSDTNGEVRFLEYPKLPIKITRTGYMEIKIDSVFTGINIIEMVSNYHLKQITVYSKKNILLKQAYSDNTSIDKEIGKLKTNGLSETKEVFRNFSELQIKDYGGASGLQTFSARGTSASQNILVIDGMIVNDMTSGAANLSLIPISSFQQIAVQTGGFSADVSNGGFGSTVYLETDLSGKNESSLNYSTGSFGSSKIGAKIRSSEENISWFFQTDVQNSQGDFEYDFIKSGLSEKRKREGNRSQSISGSGGLAHSFSEWKISTLLFSTLQKQGVPGPVFFDNEFNSESQLELFETKSISSMSRIYGESILRFSSLFKYQQYEYSENETAEVKKKEKDIFTEKEIAFRGDYLTGENKSTWNSGFYFRFNSFNSNQLNLNIDRKITERFSLSLFTVFNNNIATNISHKVSLRLETANQLPSVVSGSYSLNYQTDHTDYLISISRIQRYPSFSELHFVSIGHPKLIPEKFIGIDAATKYYNDFLTFQLKGFTYLVNDKIISIPKNAVQWTTLNLDEVRGFGIEQNLNGHFGELNYDESVTFQSIRSYNTVSSQTEGKYLVYTPQISGSFSANYSFQDFTPFAVIRFTGDQFYSAENSENEKINSFWIVNSGINYEQYFHPIQMHFQFQVKNIFDRKYEWVRSYPQPGRSWELSCEASL